MGYLAGQYGAWGRKGNFEGYFGYSDGGVLGKHPASGHYGYLGMETRAGLFSGDVDIMGKLTKTSGAFRIDHPLDPENKYLQHSFVESPDMKNVYDGIALLDDSGEAAVVLPSYFEALNRDFRYQLTCMGGWAPVYVAQEISGNAFVIAGGKPGLKVSWQVTGIRQDAYARAHPIEVELDKPREEQGRYRHAREQGAPDALSIDAERLKQFEDDRRRQTR